MQHDYRQQCRVPSTRKRRKMDALQHAETEEEGRHDEYADPIADELGRMIEEFTDAEEEKQEGADDRVGKIEQLQQEKG